MRTAELAGKKVELYDAIDELPVWRFHKYNKFVIVDLGVGADLSSVENHIVRAMNFIETNPADALKELENFRQSIHLIVSELSPKHYAFAALVKSIGGIEQNDLSDEGVKRILKEISDEKVGKIDEELSKVKKKSTKS